jgi:hypothetical protein
LLIVAGTTLHAWISFMAISVGGGGEGGGEGLPQAA